MKRLFFNGLIWKISVIIILIESVILALTGTYYTNRFAREIDKRIENRIKIPGSLMNRQQLTYKSVSDRDIMTELVGEEFADGIVFGTDKKVFYALDSDYLGKHVADIPEIDAGWIDKEITEPKILELSDRGDTYLISMTPLTAYKEAQPFFFVYIKVNTSRLEAQKTAVAGFFIASSVFCVVLTSLLIIGFIQIFVIKPLGNLERNADMLAQGDLEQEIRINRKDELGNLARSFRYMRDAISLKIAQLKELNRTLEEKVEERTKGLGERVKELKCLYSLSNLAEVKGVFLEDILQRTVEFIPPSWQYPQITEAKITVDGQEFKTADFQNTPWTQNSDIIIRNQKIGSALSSLIL